MLGDFALGPRGEKGDMLLTVCCLNKLAVWNTMFEDPGSQYTCHRFQRAEPNQIDFIAGRLNKLRVKSCGTPETTATITDHRPLVLTLYAKGREPAFVQLENGPRHTNWLEASEL